MQNLKQFIENWNELFSVFLTVWHSWMESQFSIDMYYVYRHK